MLKADLIVTNACIVTMDKNRRILDDAALAVVGDTIAAVGDSDQILREFESDRVIDATDKALFPGFINTHSHLFQVLLKGLGRDKLLFDWLDSSVRRALYRITPERAKAAARVGCMESLRSGVTTVLDYQYCHGFRGVDDAVLEAMEETGIRALLGRGFSNVKPLPDEFRPAFVEEEDEFFSEIERLAKEYRQHPRLGIAIAPGIIWDVSPKAFVRLRELSEQYGLILTMHLNESMDDDEYSRKTFGMDTVPYLEQLGFLGPNFVAVHCVNMQADDIEILKKHDVKISHNTVSNMILASGVAPVPEFMGAGLTIGLGIDGAASSDMQDMLEVVKATALIHKCVRQDASIVNAEEVLEMATLGGAACIGRAHDLGSIEVGKKADFFLFNPKTPKAVPMADPISTLVYSSSEENIDTSVVGGRVLLENGRYLLVDEAAALDECQRAAAEIREETGLGNTHWGRRVKVGPFRK
ncbi:MAG: amidohydrolase [Bacillota bacterium]